VLYCMRLVLTWRQLTCVKPCKRPYLLARIKGQICNGCWRHCVIRRPSVVRPVVTSQKQNKIDP